MLLVHWDCVREGRATAWYFCFPPRVLSPFHLLLPFSRSRRSPLPHPSRNSPSPSLFSPELASPHAATPGKLCGLCYSSAELARRHRREARTLLLLRWDERAVVRGVRRARPGARRPLVRLLRRHHRSLSRPRRRHRPEKHRSLDRRSTRPRRTSQISSAPPLKPAAGALPSLEGEMDRRIQAPAWTLLLACFSSAFAPGSCLIRSVPAMEFMVK